MDERRCESWRAGLLGLLLLLGGCGSEALPARDGLPIDRREVEEQIGLAHCMRTLRPAEPAEAAETCAYARRDGLAYSYVREPTGLPAQVIRPRRASGDLIVYLVGGPASRPLIDRRLAKLLIRLYPGATILVPAYAGTATRMPRFPARSLAMSRGEVDALLAGLRTRDRSGKLLVVADSYGAIVADGLRTSIDGLLLLSPAPAGGAEALRRLDRIAGMEGRKGKDRTRVTVLESGREPMVDRVTLVREIMRAPEAARFEPAALLARHRCSLAVIGGKDRLFEPTDPIFAADLAAAVLVRPDQGHPFVEAWPAADVKEFRRRWSGRCGG